MEFPGRYSDGVTARTEAVAIFVGEADGHEALVLRHPETGDVIERLPYAELYAVPSREGELRIGAETLPSGARLSVTGSAQIAALRRALPGLDRRHAGDRRRDLRTLGLALAALVSVIAAYVVGVPLLAGQIVAVMPTSWEAELGRAAQNQINGMLSADGRVPLCDTDPESFPNQAITRFITAAMEGSASPFTPRVDVVQSPVPNAFALPGGSIFYFSALLDETRTPDEFAGVLAHELGHVVGRDGMETLVATSATGLLVGFVLGDMTGLSVASSIGAAVIDTRFSRDAEREADAFAVATAQRLGFDAGALGTLLERIDATDASMSIFSLLNSHPMTAERLEALKQADSAPRPTREVFTDAEWRAIKHMCTDS